ncbi:hypothetical protein K488DRAFT_69083 [Vararia minispora EC-137]|uniref:Uncharacterized protein n=1 Tax=Vararia minispora EC-137 TaxID=1314806 RepID=A0ACB8QSF9_9AGAM|nr:hypothetical protein K488DRAFT_69083 [Vararia minispora EC-137]
MPNSITDGTYTLTHVSSGNIAVLDSNQDRTPVSLGNKSGQDFEKWVVTDQGNGRYTFQNHGQKKFAYVGDNKPAGAAIVGLATSQQFAIEETSESFKFRIATTDTGHLWGAQTNQPGAPVDLRSGPTDRRNWWTFNKV